MYTSYISDWPLSLLGKSMFTGMAIYHNQIIEECGWTTSNPSCALVKPDGLLI